MQLLQELDRLIASSMSELMDHLMQNDFHSPHIKTLKDNLVTMRQLISQNRIDFEQTIPSSPLQPTRTQQRSSVAKVDKSEMLKMAFVLSKFDYIFFNQMFSLSLNQTEVFEMVANIMEVKSTTLRNHRDAFDAHVKQVNSNRQGWKKPLGSDLQIVLDTFDKYSEKDMAQEIKRTLELMHPDIDLLIKVAFGFLFVGKGSTTNLMLDYCGTKMKVIIAPHTDRIAYMVFMGFGNSLQKGIYPGIYVYRRFSKVFTVYGESVTNPASNKWNIDLSQYNKIRQHFSTDEINELSRLTHDYLENIASKEFALDSSAETNGEYRLQFAQDVVDDLKNIMNIYITQNS